MIDDAVIFFVDGEIVFGPGAMGFGDVVMVFGDDKADELCGSFDFFCSIFLLKVSKNVFCQVS